MQAGEWKVKLETETEFGIFSNPISAEKLFNIITPATPPSSSGGGGSSSSRRGNTHNLGSILAGSPREYRKGDLANFIIKNQPHQAKVNNVGIGYVELTISSTPFSTRLTEGETRQYDLDDDNINDLEVSLTNIIGSKAFITFREIPTILSASVSTLPTEVPEDLAEEIIEPEEPPAGLGGITGQATSQQRSGSSAVGWAVAISIVLVGLLIYIIFRRKKETT